MFPETMTSDRLSRLLSVLTLVVLGLLASGCKKGVFLQPCHTTRCIAGGVSIGFSENIGSVSAWSLYETREVDPNIYAHDGTSTPTGTVKVALANGSSVTYTGPLYLDTSTYIAPTTAGHTVLVYRPADPNGLQAFIDQYKEQAISTEIDTLVKLADVSDGSISSSMIDFKANYSGNLEYIGSVRSSPPSSDPFNQDV